jgi:hypothetical protein
VFSASGMGSATVGCPSSLPRAVGGGGWSPGSNDVLSSSAPVFIPGSPATGWTVSFYDAQLGGPTSSTVYAYAICAP